MVRYLRYVVTSPRPPGSYSVGIGLVDAMHRGAGRPGARTAAGQVRSGVRRGLIIVVTVVAAPDGVRSCCMQVLTYLLTYLLMYLRMTVILIHWVDGYDMVGR